MRVSLFRFHEGVIKSFTSVFLYKRFGIRLKFFKQTLWEMSFGVSVIGVARFLINRNSAVLKYDLCLQLSLRSRFS